MEDNSMGEAILLILVGIVILVMLAICYYAIYWLLGYFYPDWPTHIKVILTFILLFAVSGISSALRKG